MAFNLKQNDTFPSMEAVLLDGNGFPVDLTRASVRFHMRNAAGAVVIDEAAIVTDEVAATVAYYWTAADTQTVGNFSAEFEVTYQDGNIETFPNASYIEIIITDDIA